MIEDTNNETPNIENLENVNDTTHKDNAEAHKIAINNDHLDKVPADPAVATVHNATAEGDIKSPVNPNHDVDPYSNQSNANHG